MLPLSGPFIGADPSTQCMVKVPIALSATAASKAGMSDSGAQFNYTRNCDVREIRPI